MKVLYASAPPRRDRALAVGLFAGLRPPRDRAHAVADLDLAYLRRRGFEGKVGQAEALMADDGGVIVAVGLGEQDRCDRESLRRAGAAATRAAWRSPSLALAFVDTAAATVNAETAAQSVVEGALLAAYTFAGHKSSPTRASIERFTVVSTDRAGALAGLARGQAVAEAVALARDLANQPAGDLTPSRLAEAAGEAAGDGVAVTVSDEHAIAARRLGGLLGVARGSAEPPRLIELSYDPPDFTADTPTLAFVGKGITFDSGGLSLKTADGMMAMKTDMSGGAAVIAAAGALAATGARVRVRGLVPATENMPSGTAIKPGDVLRICNGKTVEVLNTDAEGRLVLADALALAAQSGADAIIDLATLTAACRVALGSRVAGLMSNDEHLAAEVAAAAERAGEPVWRLPLPAVYRKELDSEVADLRNVATGSAGGGALVAGLFLEEFVGGRPWAHIDMAGPARADADDAYIAKGGTGFGVRTILELARSWRGPQAP